MIDDVVRFDGNRGTECRARHNIFYFESVLVIGRTEHNGGPAIESGVREPYKGNIVKPTCELPLVNEIGPFVLSSRLGQFSNR